MIDAAPFTLSRRALLAGLALVPATAALAERDDAAIAAIERAHGGRLGVFALDTGSGRTLRHRAEERFLMCSSFKGLLAACVLARIDAGRERLDARVRIDAGAVLPYSPVVAAHVGAGTIAVGTLIDAILIDSDNSGANLLLERIGGPAGLTAYVRGLGDTVTRLDRTEPTLNHAAGLLDTTTPAAIAATLRTVYLGGVLAPASLARLERGMIANARGPMRLRAGLPRRWTVGDRTGSSDDYCNDYAFARRPGAAPIVMAAYYERSGLAMPQQEAVLRAVGTAIAHWAG